MKIKIKDSSETGFYNKIRFLEPFLADKNKCGTLNNDFCRWFVGYTDGDGCFNVYLNETDSKINLTYKLSQKENNIQVLYYMKKLLGVGKVRKDKYGMAHLLIRDKKSLENVIIPLFESFPLKTDKIYSFKKFKKSLSI